MKLYWNKICKLIYCYKVGFLYFQAKIHSKLDVFLIIKSHFVWYLIGITFSISKRKDVIGKTTRIINFK